MRTAMRAAVLACAGLMLANCAATPQYDWSGYRPASGSFFTAYVRSGDTVSEIAERYRVREEDIVALNNLPDRNTIRAGDQLYVPAYGVGRPPVDARPIYQQRAPAAAPASRGAIQRRSLSTPASYRPGVATAPAPRFAPQAAPAPGMRFVWPVNGRVLSAYGRTASGERNDGINIAVASGTPFRAAAAGEVTYVGNELRGYGNLLLIRHDNGYVTAYAHADRIAVQRGQRVAAGTVVGYTGATGDVTQPQLHFEIRQGTRPVNPVALLDRPNANQASLTPSAPAKS